MERYTEWLDEETKTEVSITHYKMRDAMVRLAKYEDTGLTPEQVRELQEKCNDCSRRKWYQMGYSDGRNCTSDCPYNTGKPCPAAEGCPGWEDIK